MANIVTGAVMLLPPDVAVEQATLTEPVAAVGGDSAVVAAMSLAFGKIGKPNFGKD
jgi:hypothetical protein